MTFETKAQEIVGVIIGIALTFLLGTIPVMYVRAMIVCAPQAGKWTPWTGTICYGEKR